MSRIQSLQPRRPLEHLAPGGRIGVIALATDFNIEAELRRMLPADVAMFTSRVRNQNPLTLANLQRMTPGISAAADCILPGTPLDVMIYACTSGTVAIGSQRIAESIRRSRPGIAVSNPVEAALAAFGALSARRVSILTPYTKAVNRAFAPAFEAAGQSVLNIAGFGLEDDTAMSFIDPRDIVEAAVESCDPDAEVLFVSCTALRAADVIERIEDRLGRPVLTSNQVLAWHSLRLIGHPASVPGYGRLMRGPAALAPAAAPARACEEGPGRTA